MADKKPQFTVETITPDRAKAYLDRNVCNRKVTERTVNDYAEAMRAGEWIFNGETIKFDDEGRLIDGQHRLMAIVESGVTLELGVFRDLKHNAFSTLDTGRKRTGGDTLSTLGVIYPNETAAASRLLWLYINRKLAGKRRGLTNAALIEFLDEHPHLVDCANRSMTKPLLPTHTRLIPASARIFAYYAASRIDAKRAERFFSELATGRYGDQRKSQPVYVLRERLLQVSAETLATPTSVKLGWLMTAWNHFYAEKPLGRLSRIPVDDPRFDPEPFASESFPA